jgi:hypothetical protein
LVAPVALDVQVIAPSSPVVQSTRHTVVDATLPASTPFPIPASTGHGIDGPSLTSTPQVGQSPPVSFGGDAPTNSADITRSFAAPVALDAISPLSPVVRSTLHTVVDATSTHFPVPASTSPGIDDGPSLTSTPQIGQSAPVSFGVDAPANSADSGFSDVLVVVSPAIPTPTGGPPQGITAATIGGLVDAVPLTSALPPGEIGISTITAPAAIATTNFTSIPSSVTSGYVVPFVWSLHTSDDCMSSVSQIDLFGNHRPFDHDDDDKFKKTSSFTTTTEVVSYSLTEISGRQTSIPITETKTTILPTVVPIHSHRSPNRLAIPNSGLAQLDGGMPLTVLFWLIKVCSRSGDCRPHLVGGCHHRSRSRCLASPLAASASACPGSYSMADVCWFLAGAGNAPGVRATL